MTASWCEPNDDDALHPDDAWRETQEAERRALEQHDQPPPVRDEEE